jgi:hypothetical protein
MAEIKKLADILVEKLQCEITKETEAIGQLRLETRHEIRGELSYLAPLGSEKISAPYFKQCFFRGGGVYYPPG